MEKVCRHCGATLLVGLQYCPGCLRHIEPKRDAEAKSATLDPGIALRGAPTAPISKPGPYEPPGFWRDIKDNWLIFNYNTKESQKAENPGNYKNTSTFFYNFQVPQKVVQGYEKMW